VDIKPTPQQIEAYRFVFIHDCTQRQAAALMGCSRQNVNHLLITLKKSNPQLFPTNGVKISIIQYRPFLDNRVVDKF
jgi:predicted DNA-binding protein (UPF0251 family)